MNTTKPLSQKSYMVAMAIMIIGYNHGVDFLAANMVPITLRHFTADKFKIACILDIHRLFGFLIQPFVAWMGDRVQTRFGRRRAFLLVAIPGSLVFVLLFGFLPRTIPHEMHAMGSTLLIVVLCYIMLQFFQEICLGCDVPMMGEAFAQNQLGKASSIKLLSANVLMLFLLNVSLKWADRDEVYPYLVIAVLLMISYAILVFVIREKPLTHLPPAERYNPWKHFKLWLSNRHHFRLGVIGSMALMVPASYGLFLSLHVTETLHLSKTLLGRSQTFAPILSILCAIPIGYLIDRIGPKYIMAMGFVLSCTASICMLTWVHDFPSLMVSNTIGAFGSTVTLIAMVPITFLHAPANQLGKVFGMVQFIRAIAAFAISLIVGYIAEHVFHNYLAGYMVCIVLTLVGAIMSLTVENVKNES